MNRFDDAANEERSDIPERSSSPEADLSGETYPALRLDVALYQDYLDDPSMSEQDKHELITALWSIVVSFVDLGFGIHPLQQAQNSHKHEHGPKDGDQTEEGLAPGDTPMLSSCHAIRPAPQTQDGSSKRKEARYDR